jgi:four helix bundle protein
MARSNVETLRVYRLAEELADRVWNIVVGWNYFARDTIGKQLVRAVDSIGANISEGSARGSFLDNKRFVRISRGSFHEAQYWLRRAYRRQLLTPAQVDQLKPLVDELGPTINAYLKSIGRRPGGVTENPSIRTTDD